MLKKSHDCIADFRRFLKSAINSIENLVESQDSYEGEAYLRRCAAIGSDAGLQALHAGFADLHDKSLRFSIHAERKETLDFLGECLRMCRETELKEPFESQTRESGTMTSGDVAKFLGITVRSVRRRVLDGTLPQPIKIGRSIRFRREDIEAVAAGK
jgi:excisionase family DNA binding protein